MKCVPSERPCFLAPWPHRNTSTSSDGRREGEADGGRVEE